MSLEKGHYILRVCVSSMDELEFGRLKAQLGEFGIYVHALWTSDEKIVELIGGDSIHEIVNQE